jgi:hypothetical protein
MNCVIFSFVRRIQHSLYAPVRPVDDLVIPKAEYPPSALAESPVHRLVARNVTLYFWDPELPIRLNGSS